MDSALDENTTALEEIILSDLASRAKAGAEVGSRRRTMNNMTTGGGNLVSDDWAYLYACSETATGSVW